MELQNILIKFKTSFLCQKISFQGLYDAIHMLSTQVESLNYFLF